MMASGQTKASQAAYRPTSLDFINLPNPIEPSAESQKHFLNGTAPLEKPTFQAASNQDFFKFVLDTNAHGSQDQHGSGNSYEERPNKFQKPNSELFLPKLPVRNAAKRLRIPPTLSGLHYPPPNAGLLPSINTEQPLSLLPRQQRTPPPSINPWPSQPAPSTPEKLPAGKETTVATAHSTPRTEVTPAAAPLRRTRRRKWSEQETEHLLKGVARFGIGSWTRILKCPEYSFNSRTALDLKDRFRVCCPDEYKTQTAVSRVPVLTEAPLTPTGSHSKDTRNQTAESRPHQTYNKPADSEASRSNPRGPVPERVTQSGLDSLGIDRPFAKTSRRPRRGYTAEEDEALLKGFKKYGNSWSSIREDDTLGLDTRRATDLRDRFRTRFPDEYKKAGLALKGGSVSGTIKEAKQPETRDTSNTPRNGNGDAPSRSALDPSESDRLVSRPIFSEQADTHDTHEHLSNSYSLRKPLHPNPTSYSFDDLFPGMPFTSANDNFGSVNTAGDDGEHIVLDRGILDWASGGGGGGGGGGGLASTAHDQSRDGNSMRAPAMAMPAATSSATLDNILNGDPVASHHSTNSSGGIDPLITLKLPTMGPLRPASIYTKSWYPSVRLMGSTDSS